MALLGKLEDRNYYVLIKSLPTYEPQYIFTYDDSGLSFVAYSDKMFYNMLDKFFDLPSVVYDYNMVSSYESTNAVMHTTVIVDGNKIFLNYVPSKTKVESERVFYTKIGSKLFCSAFKLGVHKDVEEIEDVLGKSLIGSAKDMFSKLEDLRASFIVYLLLTRSNRDGNKT